MGGIFFTVKAPPVPPAPEWVSYFDNTRWGAAESGKTSLQGQGWTINDGGSV